MRLLGRRAAGAHFCIAIIISTTFICDTTSTIFAGVIAVVSGTMSLRLTFGSQSMLASLTESMAITSSARARLMP